LGGRIESKSVKIDITRGEKLLFAPVDHAIFKDYQDMPKEDFSLRCYPLEEIMVEKLVALMGRTQPRDLYDIWYLLEENAVQLDFLKPDTKNTSLPFSLPHDSEKRSNLKICGINI
jgi:uncharacterized protein